MRAATAKRSTRHEQPLDSLPLPEELDIDVLGEFPGLRLESDNESALTKEDEESGENELEKKT